MKNIFFVSREVLQKKDETTDRVQFLRLPKKVPMGRPYTVLSSAKLFFVLRTCVSIYPGCITNTQRVHLLFAPGLTSFCTVIMASPSTTIDPVLMLEEGAPTTNGSGNTSTWLDPPSTVINCPVLEPIPYCDTWDAFLDKYSLATEGIGLFSVAIIGILANSLSITILAQRTMKTQISALLITLAVFDIMFLFCTFPVFTVSSANKFVGYLNQCIYPEGKKGGGKQAFKSLNCVSMIMDRTICKSWILKEIFM